MGFVTHLFDTSDFPARWNCGNWTAGHGWLHILSDLGVWSAYMAIPCALFIFMRRRDLPFRKVFLLFGAFILLCGMTHLMEAIIFWWPAYRLAGVLKLATAIVSWTTVLALIPIVPKVLALRSPEELEREIVARQQAEAALQRINTDLELRVEERSAELKQAIIELGRERELLSTTLLSIGDGLITTDQEGRVTSLNPIAEALTGWTTREAQGQPLTTVFQIVNEETREPVLNPVFKALQEGVVVGLANHTLLIHRDGTERPIDDSASPIRGADLVIKGCVLVFRDITERQRIEHALRESEHQLRVRSEILEQVNDVVGAIDTEQRIMFLNSAGEQLYGVKASEMIGRHVTELYERRWPSPEQEAQAFATLRETGQAQWELVHITRDGRELQVESKVAVFRDNAGKPMGVIASIRDMTAQKQAAEELRASQHFLERVTEITPGVIHVFDLEQQRSIFINRTIAIVLGYSPAEVEEMGNQLVQTLMHPDDLPRFAAHTQALRQLPDNVILDFEHRMRDQSGTWHWFHSRDTVFARNATGEVSRIIGTAINITARKQAEDRLKESEQRFRQTLMNVSVPTLLHAEDDTVLLVNHAWTNITGYGMEDLPTIGDWTQKAYGERSATVRGFIDTLFDNDTPFDNGEFTITTATGEQRLWHFSSSPVGREASGRRLIVSSAVDITEEKQAADVLRASEERFRSLVTATTQIVWTTDPQGVVIEDSPTWRAVTGQTVEEWVGSGWTNALHPDDREATVAAWQRAVETQTAFVVEYRLRRHDGVYLWMSVRAVPVMSEAGVVREWVGTNTDITERKLAEVALRQNAELFARVVEQAPTGMFVVDAKFRMQQVNALAAPVFGHVQPLIGRDLSEVLQILWGPEIGVQVAEIFRHTLVTGEHYVSPGFVEQRQDTGVEEAYEWEAQRVTLADGQLGVVCYFQDITERQRAEEALLNSQSLTRLATEATEVGIWEWNLQTNTLHWDAQMFRIYGIDPTEDGVVNYSVWSGALFPEDLPENERILHDTVRRSGQSRREFRIHRRSDGQERIVDAVEAVRRNSQGRANWVVGTNLDVTARKKLEEDLRVTAAEMSESSRRKDEFLAMLAHELRNPLAPVRTGLEIVKLYAGPGKQIQSATAMMTRQVEQMVRLVDDLMDVSRISRGKIELRQEQVELATIIQHAVEAARPQCETRGQQLSVSLPSQPITLYADSARLIQVVGNLLTNASKFTDNGGQISLSVERTGGGESGLPEEAVIRVLDNGIGIPTDQLPLIFQMFVQLKPSLEKSAGGLGIGLALVKNLIEMHNGHVEVHSDRVGQGTEFTVRLPVLVETPQLGTVPEITVSDENRPTTTLRVLIVDDNVDAADAMEMLLGLNGYETQTANDGLQAVEAARTFHPDVVLLDIGLPKLNGHEVARHIRAEPWGQTMVLIALTGWGQDADRKKTLDAGFNAHLVKPVDLQLLERMLEEIGEKKQG